MADRTGVCACVRGGRNLVPAAFLEAGTPQMVPQQGRTTDTRVQPPHKIRTNPAEYKRLEVCMWYAMIRANIDELIIFKVDSPLLARQLAVFLVRSP